MCLVYNMKNLTIKTDLSILWVKNYWLDYEQPYIK